MRQGAAARPPSAAGARASAAATHACAVTGPSWPWTASGAAGAAVAPGTASGSRASQEHGTVTASVCTSSFILQRAQRLDPSTNSPCLCCKKHRPGVPSVCESGGAVEIARRGWGAHRGQRSRGSRDVEGSPHVAAARGHGHHRRHPVRLSPLSCGRCPQCVRSGSPARWACGRAGSGCGPPPDAAAPPWQPANAPRARYHGACPAAYNIRLGRWRLVATQH